MWLLEHLIWPQGWTECAPRSPTEGGKGVDGVDSFVHIFVMSLAVCKYGCPVVIVV